MTDMQWNAPVAWLEKGRFVGSVPTHAMKRRCFMRSVSNWTLLGVLPLLFALEARANSLLATGLGGQLWDETLMWELDPITGATLSTRLMDENFTGISFAPDGTLYGLASSNGPSSLLYRIDPATGTTKLVGALGIQANTGDLAVDPVTGVLYGSAGQEGTIFSVDPRTGKATVLATGDQKYPNVEGLAFNSAGTLYALTYQDALLKIDATDGHTISVLPLNFSVGEEAKISFDPITGKLYATNNYPGSNGAYDLYTINLTTGDVTIAAPIGIDYIEGLAFVPSAPIPEPAGLLPLGAALGLLWLLPFERMTLHPLRIRMRSAGLRRFPGNQVRQAQSRAVNRCRGA
jgi:outer membrane protein assembly factor BamB